MIKIILLLALLFPSTAYAQFGGGSPLPTNLIIKDDGTRVGGSGRTIDLRSNLTTTYDSLTSTWHFSATGGGGGGGSAIAVQEGDSTVAASIDSLDFQSGFDVSESPANEANVSIDLSEVVTGDLTFTTNSANINSDTIGATELAGINSLTATSGRVLVADGNAFNSVAVSGDVSVDSTGAVDLTELSVEAELESVLDLQELQGAVTDGQVPNTITIDNATTAANLGADGVDALTEIAQSIKTASDDTSKLVVGTAGSTNDCAKWDSTGALVTAGAACGSGGGGASSLTGLTDVNSATQGAGRILVSDGFDFQSTTVSGDIAITSGGVVAIQADSVVLTTDTTGNYAAGDAEAGNATGVACTDCVALGTETSGSYAAGDAEAGSATSVAASTVGASQLTSSGVTAATYNAATLTVDADGRITAAASSSLTGLNDVNSATTTSGRMLMADGTDFHSIALSGDVTVAFPGTATIAADSVALGTDTTGNYAGSSSEGGAATTATALAANGANCSAGSYPLGVDASGAVESCTVAGAGGGASSLTGLSDVNSATQGLGRLLVSDGNKFNSVELLTVNYVSNNVGIGSTTPRAKLEIVGTGNVGIGTASPQKLFEVKGGDIYLNQTSGGIHMKSPDGSCAVCTLSNLDAFTCSSETCP